MKQPELGSSTFRKADIHQRRTLICDPQSPGWTQDDVTATSADPSILDLADVMVENALGILAVPLGIAQGFLIDGQKINIPLAVEEPSVIAAASYAASLIAKNGGFTTQTRDPVMTGQIYLEFPDFHGTDIRNTNSPFMQAMENLKDNQGSLEKKLEPILEPMEKRGGGFRGFEFTLNDTLNIVRIHFFLDVRDAMGANLINTCAEALRPEVERITGGTVLMAILSNGSEGRLTKASFSLPFSALNRGRYSGEQLARRIVRGCEIAQIDPARGVTHNKGIMNGISSLALATANDTRGIEAAAHAWASRSGQYSSLSRYWIADERLWGEIELPLAFAVVGGGVGFHPGAQAVLKILDNPTATRLGAIAAALGLAQNFAALAALTGEGIQAGHMRLHAGRLAYSAGARGWEISHLQSLIVQSGTYNIPTAKELLIKLRSEKSQTNTLQEKFHG